VGRFKKHIMNQKIKIVNGKIITTRRILPQGSLLIEGNRITAVSENTISAAADITIDAEGNYISPGFIDIHIHGGGGSDFMDGTVDAFLKIAETHSRFGTTAMVPTTLTSEKENLLHILNTYRQAAPLNHNGARFLGMHIEGPYFALSQKGAQDPRYIRKPDQNEYSEIIEKSGDVIARWSAAPELEGALEFGRYLRSNNILAAIAHTDALYDDVVKASENGYSLATHFYSSMSGVTRRNAYRYAGVVESVYLMDEIKVEIIADGSHLPAPLLQLIHKIKGASNTALITDAMRAAGTADTESILGPIDNGLPVIIEDGVAKLPDRTSFAGSVATTDRLVRTMVRKAGVSLVEAVAMMSITPAGIMGVAGSTGSLSAGKYADVVIFDDDIHVLTTFVDGNIVFNKM
jgi:N-acetylglucosamine-6-phosphate deacetylase